MGLQSTPAAKPALQTHIDQAFAAFGRQGLPQTQSLGSPQGQLPSLFAAPGASQRIKDVAEKFLTDEIIAGGNRWWLVRVERHLSTEIVGDQITVKFSVVHGFWQNLTCQVQFTFQGKNLGGVKQHDLVGASLDGWRGAWKSDLASMFEGVAKDYFNSTVGKIEC